MITRKFPQLCHDLTDDGIMREHALLYAILVRALLDFCNIRFEISSASRRDAAKWFASDSKKPWSFLWLCSHLEVCPKRVREFLTTMEDKASAREIYKKFRHFKVRRRARVKNYRTNACRLAP